MNKYQKLYYCIDESSLIRKFIVAWSHHQAKTLFTTANGVIDRTTLILIGRLPQHLQNQELNLATDEVLRACKCKILYHINDFSLKERSVICRNLKPTSGRLVTFKHEDGTMRVWQES